MVSKRDLKKLGGTSISVGDVLLEVDEVLRPLIDLSAILDKTRHACPDDPVRIPYRDEHDAYRAQCCLRLLLQDGEDITVGRTMHPDTKEFYWVLNVPHKLFVRPEGADRAPSSNITDRIDWFQERRDAIAEQLHGHKYRAAEKARALLWGDLKKLGLVVTIPDPDLQRLLALYEKLPGLEKLGGPEAQLAQLIPFVESLVQESGTQRGELGAKSPQETAFIMTLKDIAEDIFQQRHQVGRQDNPNDSRSYFPDDFSAVLKAALERGLGKGRLDTPTAVFPPPRDPFLLSLLVPPTQSKVLPEGRIVSRLNPKSLGREKD